MNSTKEEKPYQVDFPTTGKDGRLVLFLSQDPKKSRQNITKVFFEAAIRNLSDSEKQMYINYLLSLSDEERKAELVGIFDKMLTNSCSK